MSGTITFFETLQDQKDISKFGRRMVHFSESGINMNVPIEILNAMTRVGDLMAETGSLSKLSKTDKMVVKYAKKVM